MAFRADEAAQDGYERARRILVLSPGVDTNQREQADDRAAGPDRRAWSVVRGYPTWHPLVPQDEPPDAGSGSQRPLRLSGSGPHDLFRTRIRFLPYGDGSLIIESVEAMEPHPCATITAERLDVPFYNSAHADPRPLRLARSLSRAAHGAQEARRTADDPARDANVAPRFHEVGERWDTMRPYLLGDPHGSRSSLFVNQETAKAMKRVYTAMVESGMFGPLRMD